MRCQGLRPTGRPCLRKATQRVWIGSMSGPRCDDCAARLEEIVRRESPNTGVVSVPLEETT